jgi:hypothetical protein
VIDIIVDANVRLSDKKKAAALFRVWHTVREMMQEAERLGDTELVHFLAVTQLLVEDRAQAAGHSITALAEVDTALPN